MGPINNNGLFINGDVVPSCLQASNEKKNDKALEDRVTRLIAFWDRSSRFNSKWWIVESKKSLRLWGGYRKLHARTRRERVRGWNTSTSWINYRTTAQHRQSFLFWKWQEEVRCGPPPGTYGSCSPISKLGVEKVRDNQGHRLCFVEWWWQRFQAKMGWEADWRKDNCWCAVPCLVIVELLWTLFVRNVQIAKFQSKRQNQNSPNQGDLILISPP